MTAMAETLRIAAEFEGAARVGLLQLEECGFRNHLKN